MQIDKDIAIKSLYILFTVFFTQIHRPVLVPVTPNTANILFEVASLDYTCKNMVAILFKNKAFSFSTAEGVKSFVPYRKNIEENSIKTETKAISNFEYQIATNVEFDSEKVYETGMKYFMAKETLKEKLKNHSELFESENFPKNKIAEYFKPSNISLLNLANPTFALTLGTKLKYINNIKKKI